uniref:Uncharacterized protein n=1 Tax=Moniliophthora roreri TaxID=221103 RepID=A0A0W0FNW3_MONRR
MRTKHIFIVLNDLKLFFPIEMTIPDNKCS